MKPLLIACLLGITTTALTGCDPRPGKEPNKPTVSVSEVALHAA